MKRTLATLISLALVGAAFVGPAEAAKKKKKKKKPAVCQPYEPGEMGAEAETVVLTDEHTEEAPLEVTVTHGMTAADFVPMDETRFPVNVQVDSNAASAGLYVLWEFPARRDYDLYLHYPTGEEAASSHGFNPLIESDGTPADISETGHGGESTASSEKLVGITSADCTGWTLDTVNWFGEGGDHTLQLWLGEGQNDPLAPGESEG